MFASRGLADGWLARGQRIPTAHYAMLSSRLDLSVLDSDFPFVLFIPHDRTEELLEEHALAMGVPVLVRPLGLLGLLRFSGRLRPQSRSGAGWRELRRNCAEG